MAFKIGRAEWGIITLAAGLVWATEAANTAIEVLADRVCKEKDVKIGIAKDLGAASVLLASLAAAIAGMLVFLPKIAALFS